MCKWKLLLTWYSTLNTSCFRYEGDKVNGLYNGEGVAYFIGGHVYQVFVTVNFWTQIDLLCTQIVLTHFFLTWPPCQFIAKLVVYHHWLYPTRHAIHWKEIIGSETVSSVIKILVRGFVFHLLQSFRGPLQHTGKKRKEKKWPDAFEQAKEVPVCHTSPYHCCCCCCSQS